MKPLIKLITEVGPLAVFFIGNSKFGIFPATAAFMLATAIAIPISWKIEGKLAQYLPCKTQGLNV